MSNNQIEVIDCVIRMEITDWFRKFINETCGPDVQIRYQSNCGHFNSHINVEISGSKSQINEAAEIIRNASDKTRYTLPWVNENTYYVPNLESMKETARDELNSLKDIDADFNYVEAPLTIIGSGFMSFCFRSGISHTTTMMIEEIFKRLNGFNPVQFIIFPQIRVPQTQSSNAMATHILTAFHGTFLTYLDEEDIFSLELANKRPDGSCYDTALDHDIQKFLRKRYPHLYTGEKFDLDLNEFKINEVLCHVIHKYRDSLTKIGVPNILTADEIQSLSCLPNIEIVKQNIIHLDFKSANDLETVEFCAIYHFDPNPHYFFNYGPKYATKNYSIQFRDDCPLDPLQCNTEFTHLVLKSQINCSPQKSNSVLQYLTKYFKAYQNEFTVLVLYGFELNYASNEIISSLLVMMRPGRVEFHEMNFNLKTLIAILGQSDQNSLVFRKCSIDFENSEGMSVNRKSSIKSLGFFNMDIDVRVLSVLKNIELLVIDNCRIVRPSWIVPINMENVNYVRIRFSSFDVSTTRRLMNGLQCVEKLSFLSCDVTPSDHFQDRCFTVRNPIEFKNMNFGIRTVIQMIENCEIQNQLRFEACHLQLENVESFKVSLKPVKLIFSYVKFESANLLTILKTLNKESEVFIANSSILPLHVNPDMVMNLVRLGYVQFSKCKLETRTLLSVLSKIARKTEVCIEACDVLHSTAKYSKTMTNLSEIRFYRTKIISQDLLSILGIFKNNSKVFFTNCEIGGDCKELPKIYLQKGITIYFENMTIPLHIARPLLQTDWTIDFDNCTLDFMTSEFSVVSIQTDVTFRNMTFDSYEQFKFLAKLFTSTSRISFVTCHFANCIMPNIANKTTHKCSLIGFKGMSLKIETILWILKNCTSLYELVFDNCKIVWPSPNELFDTKLKVEILSIQNMEVDVQRFHTFVNNCIEGLTVCIVKCEIIPARSKILSYPSVEIGHLVLKDVPYSPELLQIFQNLNGECNVEYRDQLSIQAISDICTESSVYGNRLILTNQICTESIYFELFAEFFLSIALDLLECDTEAEYDLPIVLIPDIRSLSNCSRYNWDQFKIKFSSVNDATVKLEFLKNGKVIDLFYELNNLSDDSENCVVDYY